MDANRRVTDPTALRALAHPSRLAILEHLAVEGPLTATDLADRLDESPANCSWHLRKLAEHGFVEEAPGASGRRRPWQVTAETWTLPEGDGPGEAEAAAAVTELVIDRALARFRRRHARRSPADVVFTNATRGYQWLTAAESQELQQELAALLSRYADRDRDPGRRPQGAHLVETVMWSTLLDDEMDPRDGHR